MPQPKTKKPYKIGIGKKILTATMGGPVNSVTYDIKPGKEIKVWDKWHWDKLTHEKVAAVEAK